MTDSASKEYEFDKLKMYFREPYIIKTGDENLIIKQPSIGDIMRIGEKEFYQTLYIYVGNTTMFRLKLWDIGIDWNKIPDYELFCMMIKTTRKEVVNMLFEDIDFETFKLYTYEDGQDNDNTKSKNEIKYTLYSEKYNIEISEETYLHIREYLRTMFNIHPKVEKAKGRTTKEWMIEEDKLNIERDKDKKDTSTLLPMISFCVNHPGFKYKLEDLKDMGIVQFMDSIQRLQIYESTVAINSGLYSGMCDLSKVDKELFNFMREK